MGFENSILWTMPKRRVTFWLLLPLSLLTEACGKLSIQALVASNYWKMFNGHSFQRAYGSEWIDVNLPHFPSSQASHKQASWGPEYDFNLYQDKNFSYSITLNYQIKFGFCLTKETTISSTVGRFTWFSRVILIHQIFVIQWLWNRIPVMLVNYIMLIINQNCP